MTARRRRPTGSDTEEAAEILRRVLEAVDRGELDADDPISRGMVRRMEGALAAWDKGDPLQSQVPV